MITVDEIIKTQTQLFEHGKKLVFSKGNDYSGTKNKTDTLMNIRLASHIGLVQNTPQSILVRLGDKYMRMVSLSDPSVTQMVKDESMFDTVSDMWNYSSYWLLAMRELNEKLRKGSKK